MLQLHTFICIIFDAQISAGLATKGSLSGFLCPMTHLQHCFMFTWNREIFIFTFCNYKCFGINLSISLDSIRISHNPPGIVEHTYNSTTCELRQEEWKIQMSFDCALTSSLKRTSKKFKSVIFSLYWGCLKSDKEHEYLGGPIYW